MAGRSSPRTCHGRRRGPGHRPGSAAWLPNRGRRRGPWRQQPLRDHPEVAVQRGLDLLIGQGLGESGPYAGGIGTRRPSHVQRSHDHQATGLSRHVGTGNPLEPQRPDCGRRNSAAPSCMRLPGVLRRPPSRRRRRGTQRAQCGGATTPSGADAHGTHPVCARQRHPAHRTRRGGSRRRTTAAHCHGATAEGGVEAPQR